MDLTRVKTKNISEKYSLKQTEYERINQEAVYFSNCTSIARKYVDCFLRKYIFYAV
jgi:hypothetical protein